MTYSQIGYCVFYSDNFPTGQFRPVFLRIKCEMNQYADVDELIVD